MTHSAAHHDLFYNPSHGEKKNYTSRAFIQEPGSDVQRHESITQRDKFWTDVVDFRTKKSSLKT